MQTRHVVRSLLLAAVVATSGLIGAQTSYQPPRTEWGVPDLQGNWLMAKFAPPS